MQVTLAVVQFLVEPLNPEKNLKRMEDFVQDAATKGAQIVVFPEDSVTGPLAGQSNFVANAPFYLSEFQRMAIEYQIDIVPGSWTAQDGTGLYNTTYYINKDGSLAGIYKKINLWENEKLRVSPGTAASVFPTAFGMVGLTICWDISFPPLFTEMNNQGVQLVISPTYWSFTKKAEIFEEVVQEEIDLIDSLCLSRAFENNIGFVYCNAAGTLVTDGIETTLSGRSQVTHPTDKVINSFEGNEEGMFLASLNIPQKV